MHDETHVSVEDDVEVKDDDNDSTEEPEIPNSELGGDGVTPAAMDPESFRSFYVDEIDDYYLTEKHYYAHAFTLDSSQNITANSNKTNISDKINSMIVKISDNGGGILEIPAGAYRVEAVSMRSNVHVLVDKGVTLYPVWVADDSGSYQTTMWNFKQGSDYVYIENCSLRCKQAYEGESGARFKVDYEMPNGYEKRSVRFSTVGYARNWHISDINFIDNNSIYCSISVSANYQDGSGQDGIDGATDGEVINCSLLGKAHPGYGLLQMHSLSGIWAENLYSKGGVTFRLETGATGAQGVHRVCAKGIYNENGRFAVMMAPHLAVNGTVMIDGVWSRASTYAVSISNDTDDDDSDDDIINPVPSFADDSRIINIHAIYGDITTGTGEGTQIKARQIYLLEREQWDLIEYRQESHNNDKAVEDFDGTGYKWLFAASVAAFNSGALSEERAYNVDIEGYVTEGFTYNKSGIIERDAEQLAEDEANKYNILDEWESYYLSK